MVQLLKDAARLSFDRPGGFLGDSFWSSYVCRSRFDQKRQNHANFQQEDINHIQFRKTPTEN